MHPEQEGDPPQEAVARVQECHETELRHKLGDGQLWKSGNGYRYIVCIQHFINIMILIAIHSFMTQ